MNRNTIIRCLLLFSLLAIGRQGLGQTTFNKRETMNAIGGLYTNVVELNGKFYATGLGIDSINYTGNGNLWYNIWGLKFGVYDQQGNKLRDTVYQDPDTTLNHIDSWVAPLHVLPDGTLLQPADGYGHDSMHLLLLRFDTLGNMIERHDYPNYAYPGPGKFLRMVDCRPTPAGDWVILGTACGGGYCKAVLYKLDSAFNLKWWKAYGTTGDTATVASRLLVEDDGYAVAVSATWEVNQYWSDGLARIYKTDTAGNLLWQWSSDTSQHNSIRDLVATPDGGYLMCGLGFGQLVRANPHLDWYTVYTAGWVEKLDANRNFLWRRKATHYYDADAYPRRLHILPDGSYMAFGQDYGPVVDSTDGNGLSYQMMGFMQHIGANGDSLERRTWAGLYSCRNFHEIYSAQPTTDGGWIMAGRSGEMCNDMDTTKWPTSRGWLLKVDGNGCLGPDDPQCWPASVGDAPALSSIAPQLYPNPTTGRLSINWPFREQAVMKLSNVQGQAVQELSLREGISVTEISNLPPGLYIWSIDSPAGRFNGKLIKQ